MPGSALLGRRTPPGCRPVREGFADRGYTPAGTLVPRREPGSLVQAPDEVAERAVRKAVEEAGVRLAAFTG